MAFSAKNRTQGKEGLDPTSDEPNLNEISEDSIDRNLMGTFPASDPPSWTLGVDRDKQPARETELE